MKFCPNCGNKLQAGDVFCEKCGYRVDQAGREKPQTTPVEKQEPAKPQKAEDKQASTEKPTPNQSGQAVTPPQSEKGGNYQDKLASLKTKAGKWSEESNLGPKIKSKAGKLVDKYKALTPKRQKGVIFLLAILLVLFIGVLGNVHGKVFPPKQLSFVKQAGQHGKHVWLQAGGNTKDSVVSSIYVVGNNGITEYYMEDNDLTLGKLSSKSDRQLISLAKEQDHKYFEAFQTNLKEYMNNQPASGQNGTFTEREDGHISKAADMIEDGAQIFYLDNRGDSSHDKYSPDLIKVISPNYKATDSEKQHLDSLTEWNLADLTPDVKKYQKMRADALLKVMKTTKYQAPKKQKLHCKNVTDSSGNNIVKQELTYNSVDTWVGRTSYDDAFYQYTDKAALRKAIAAHAPAGADISEADKAKKTLENEYAKCANRDIYEKAMRKAFFYSDSPYTFSLTSTTKFDIYQANYVGYTLSSDDYLVTKAQNSGQTAMMEK